MDTNTIISGLGLELHEAQIVLTNAGSTDVYAWLSKEGTLYFKGGLIGADKLEKELQDMGYYLVPRFNKEG